MLHIYSSCYIILQRNAYYQLINKKKKNHNMKKESEIAQNIYSRVVGWTFVNEKQQWIGYHIYSRVLV